MSATVSVKSRVAPAQPEHPSTRARRLATVLVALVAVWTVTLLAHVAGVDWLLPILIWVGVASLLRGGRTALDRLMLGSGLLFGATAVAGLVLSVWPWHLSPVPVDGTALSGLVLIAAVLDRKPTLPLRRRFSDLTVVGVFAVCVTLIGYVFRGLHFPGKLSMLAQGDDLARHLMVYDTIRVVGGYLFQHRAAALPYLDPGYESYPQAIHFVYALLAGHFPQGAHIGDTVASFDLMMTFDIATYLFMCLAVLWATRWVGGHLLNGWASVPVIGAVGVYLFFGPPITLLFRGFPSEAAGCALLALLIAVVIRPVHRTREQVLLVSALLIGVSFTYFLFLPLSLGAAALWAVRYRRRLARHLPLSVALGLVTIVLCAVPPILNVVYSPASVGERLLLGGAIAKVERPTALALFALVTAGVVVGALRRSPVWRASLLYIVGSAGLTVTVYLYQVATLDRSSYYFEKFLHQTLVVTMVSAGAVVYLVRRPHEWRPVPARRYTRLERLASLVPVVALTSAVFVWLGVFPPTWTRSSYGLQYLRRTPASWSTGAATWQAISMFPHADGRVTMILVGSPYTVGDRYASQWSSVFTAALQRAYPAERNTYWWDAPWEPVTEADLEVYLLTAPHKFRVIVGGDQWFNLVNTFADKHPEADLQIVDVRSPK